MTRALATGLAATTPAVREKLAQRHVVLIGGFVQEGIFGYFDGAKAVLKREFPLTPVSGAHPISPRSASDNANRLSARIPRLFDEGGGKPLLLVAHSHGGSAALLSLLRNPAFVRDGIVDRAILVQAPVQGSHLADAALEKFPFLRRYEGVSSLQTSYMKRAVGDALGNLEDPALRALVSERVLYLRAARQDVSRVFWALRRSHRYLSARGPNDGFILAECQMHPELGRDLGVIDADHSTFFYPSWMSGEKSAFKQAFFRGLLSETC